MHLHRLVGQLHYKRLLMVVALVGLLTPLLIQSLGTAWAQDTSPVQLSLTIGEPTLLAKGAAASVPVTLSCSGLADVSYGNLSVRIDQRGSKQQINRGSGGASLDGLACDGSAQSFTINVSPQAPYGEPVSAFKRGTVLVTASAYVCGSTVVGGDYSTEACGETTTSVESRLG